MEKKSKYSLFPVPPSSPPRTPLPIPPEDADDAAAPPPPDIPLPPRRKSSIIDLDPYLPPPRHTTAPSPQNNATVPAPLVPGPSPILRNPFTAPPRTSSAAKPPRNPSPISEEAPPLPPVPEMLHSPCSSTSSAASFQKPPPPTQSPSRTRPRTVYFHTGLGGAGNYRKAIREDNILRATVPGQHRSPRFLASLFGSKKKARRQQYGESDSAGSSQSSLGAAEVMRRKMLGFGSDGKTGANRN